MNEILYAVGVYEQVWDDGERDHRRSPDEECGADDGDDGLECWIDRIAWSSVSYAVTQI